MSQELFLTMFLAEAIDKTLTNTLSEQACSNNTDSGSNFVRCFELFDCEGEGIGEDDLEAPAVAEVGNATNVEQLLQLPRHGRSRAHTKNLQGLTDMWRQALKTSV